MSNQPIDNSQKFGKWMMYLTWIIALALASYFFQNLINYKHNPNASLSNNSGKPVVLKQNSQGHYVATGTINHTPVLFLLDTGATSVVVSSELAKQLNLKPTGKAQVSTANGIITVQRTKLETVSLGSLSAQSIDAYINPYGDNTVLLGMSFLKHLSLLQQNKTLTLSAPK
jgi:aspartyl protease family protein